MGSARWRDRRRDHRDHVPRGLASGWRWGLGLVLGGTAGYGISFLLVVLALWTMPVSTAYPVWSGLGVVGVTLLAMLVHGERMPPTSVTGVVVLPVRGASRV